MAIRLSVPLLRQIPLFRNMNETEYRQLADIAAGRSFNPGEVILNQGETSRELWIVLEGTCEVAKRLGPAKGKEAPGGSPRGPSTSPSKTVVLAVLEPFSHFGEMSFFRPAPHSADVRARSAVELLRIAYPDYQDLISEGVTAAYKLAYNVVETLADRLRRMDEWVAELLAEDKSPAVQVEE